MIKRLFNQTTRWLDLHLFLVWLLTIPAILPLMKPTLTRSADGLLHLYRIVALEQAVSQGEIFPRWLPDLAYGYGFPLFIFYAPLSYYITLALNLLGLETIVAFNTSFILALLLAGTGAYLFVKELFGPKAGLLAGMAYVYAPFQILNALSRGGLPAAWAMALFPFVFWIFTRLIRCSDSKLEHIDPLASIAQNQTTPDREAEVRLAQRSKGENSPLPPRPPAPLQTMFSTPLLPLSALTFAMALLAHNTLSLLFVPLLGLYLGLELLARLLWWPSAATRWQMIVHIGLAVFLGVGLAAFFLIPAILEREFVQIQRVITPPDFDFHFHFVSLKELFSLPQPANTGLLNPDFPLTLGLVQVGLAVVGWLSLLIYYLRQAKKPSPSPLLTIIAFTTLALIGAIYMMLPISVGVWERVPLLAFVQFPHRLLGPAALVMAVLAGAAVTTLPRQLSFSLTLIGVLLIFTTAIPLLYPRYYDPPPARPTLPDMMAYEHASGVIGTTSFGEYLPVWVKAVPRQSPLEPMYQAGVTIERLDPTSLPPNAATVSAIYTFNQADLVIDSPEPYRAIFHTFYFPGWQALVDNEPVLITPTGDRGLIGIDMPKGQRRLELHFQETPLRRRANSLSVGVLVLTLLNLLIGLTRGAWPQKSVTHHVSRITLTGFTHSQLATLTGLAILLISVKLLYFDWFDTPLKHTFNGTTVPGAGVSMQINFGEQVNLLGYDLNQVIVEPGQHFNLTVYWQARQPLATNYSALAQLVDAERHLYAGQDSLHPGSLPATQWQPWGFVQDPHPVFVPHGTPPGDYFVATGLYQPTTWTRLPVMTNSDSTWGDVMVIPVTVAGATRIPSLAELEIDWPVEQDFRTELRLLGATPERDVIRRNDFLRIAIFWEALKKPQADYKVNLRLVAATDEMSFTGEGVLQTTGQPSHNRYPTTRWSAGERVRDNHALWIPADFPPGAYRVQVRALDETRQDIGTWVNLGAMSTAKE